MIHPTAVISPEAKLGAGVTVGPFAVIDAGVEVGDGVRIGPHVVLCGRTRIGTGTRIHAGAVLGDEPQDLHYDGGDSCTVIGRNCLIREYVTVHRGAKAGTETVVGDHVMLMAFSHLGHNCRLADHVVVANASLLAGHVEVGAGAFVSGGVLVHQFCRIGPLAMIGGGSRLNQDVPPYCMFQLGGVRGPNVVGMRRSGLAPEGRKAVRAAIKTFFFSGLNRANALADIRTAWGTVPAVQLFLEFIETTRRGICTGRMDDRAGGALEEEEGELA